MSQTDFYHWLDNLSLTHYAKLGVHRIISMLQLMPEGVPLSQASQWLNPGVLERIRDCVRQAPSPFLSFDNQTQLFKADLFPYAGQENTRQYPDRYWPVLTLDRTPSEHYQGLMPLSEKGQFAVVSHYLVLKLNHRYQVDVDSSLERIYQDLLQMPAQERPVAQEMPLFIERMVELHQDAQNAEAPPENQWTENKAWMSQVKGMIKPGRRDPLRNVLSRYQS